MNKALRIIAVSGFHLSVSISFILAALVAYLQATCVQTPDMPTDACGFTNYTLSIDKTEAQIMVTAIILEFLYLLLIRPWLAKTQDESTVLIALFIMSLVLPLFIVRFVLLNLL
jgi:hypothetical protein